ncbi:FepA family TonB-dependent siderophore receptor [Thauera linaloolentis]|uniref:Outer membrane receptor FepA n=1 Tax=Thauera linaloolentis (strain DSM 12138 / JCM 21573 / CCUG 41526 / CIP 105981 / IAM 15112 / NBRC 102519 / 47Lol) TaxID=1123367 RepID=N6YXW8_THAL4|nr:FepA family TonB-dependent siderophore receptor [Thauera linaloolentis]ENO86983.1 outer membrane receptor FepA [Thauera linaloolentis 47Lol = DSM 12138]MCM8564443.1 FepA family TonB-dependent siderophore receptor [Thauera linaloolentis]
MAKIRPLAPAARAFIPCLLGAAISTAWAQASSANDTGSAKQLDEVVVLGSAEDQGKQSLGVSVITNEDIERTPPVNDLSDILRRQPGVNLTGNGASGQRGNNRQIDIRGMGPENTLILVDGKPVSSRNAVRYGWRGDRDTRGDTNWVPAEMVERIEVLRGPAAARYGSGAMGGVVNIITKAPAKDKLSGSLTYYADRPQDGKEGDTDRINFNLSGPLGETLSARIYGNYNKAEPDALSLNKPYIAEQCWEGWGCSPGVTTGGREGVVNKDFNGLLSWRPDARNILDLEASFSRQGNRYAGDTLANEPVNLNAVYNTETNIMYRQAFSVSHRGRYDWGSTQASLSHDVTRNRRLREGLGGGYEGVIGGGDDALSAPFDTSRLKNTRLHAQVDMPFPVAGFDQVLTAGLEVNREHLDDPGGMRDSITPGYSGPTGGGGTSDGTVSGMSPTTSRQNSQALFVESNMAVTEQLIVTPGLRFDHNSAFGNNWSPSLNAEYALTSTFTIKAGVARAYKAPNLYQSTENYLLASGGRGCFGAGTAAVGPWTDACFLLGNPDLEPETSINQEIGFAYAPGTWRVSATYFRNDYKNKVDAGHTLRGRIGDYNIYRWENMGKALVHGIEGNLFIPISRSLQWNNNLTYMIDAERREGPFKGEPLSITPEFTLNSTLDWFASDKLSFQATATVFGKQKPPTMETGTSAPNTNLQEIKSYSLFGLSTGYEINKNFKLRAGVSNVFDKRLYRKGDAVTAGAQTYNERGRAFYLSATASF